MTLAIAVIENLRNGRSQVYLGSDSRMTNYGGGECSHYCVKVSPVRVRVVGPQEEEQEFDDASILFDKQYGLAFSGNVAGMHVFKCYLDVALANLQYVQLHSPLSFDRICETVRRLYQAFVDRLSNDLGLDYSVEFFFAGLDPGSDKAVLRLARFKTVGEALSSGSIKYDVQYQFCSKENEAYAIGSGANDFNAELGKLFSQQSIAARAFAVLDRICKDESIKSVGGMRQVGFFDQQGDFVVHCVNGEDPITEEFGDFLAGLNLNMVDEPGHGLVVRRRMIEFTAH